ncbi:MAG: hypothetical protein WA947_17885 [Phormidesmis sp.]
MARQKRGSRTLDKAQRRLSSVRSIDAKLALDGGITAADYEKRIVELRTQIDAYNTTLSTVDELYNKIKLTEQQLSDYSERVLIGVAAKYGKNSNQYEMAGGVKKSERKRPARKLTMAK